MDNYLTFLDPILEDAYCKKLDRERYTRSKRVLGHDLVRILAVVATVLKRLQKGAFSVQNSAPAIVMLCQLLLEWRVHLKRLGTWRQRSAFSVFVSISMVMYITTYTYTYVEPVTYTGPLMLTAFFLATSGVFVLHIAGMSTITPFTWKLLQQSVTILLLFSQTHTFCASQPGLQRAIKHWLVPVFHYFGETAAVEERNEACILTTQVSLIVLGYILSLVSVYHGQLKQRKDFVLKQRRNFPLDGDFYKSLSNMSLKNLIRPLMAPITIILFYTVALKHV